MTAEVPRLMEMANRPDEMCLVTGSVLRGYLLLRLGHTAEAIELSEVSTIPESMVPPVS